MGLEAFFLSVGEKKNLTKALLYKCAIFQSQYVNVSALTFK